MMAGISARVVPVKKKPEFNVDFSIDGHSHIQSGSTAPLPLIWNQMANIQIPRSILDALAPIAVKGGNIQRKKTEEIAEILVNELMLTYGSGSKLLDAKPYSSSFSDQQKAEMIFSGDSDSIFSPVIIMPMDMDYAHIAGFPPESTTIYHEGKFQKWISGGGQMPPVQITVDGVYYYNRSEAPAPEENGILVDVSHERPNRVWVYQSYKKQHKDTIASVKNNPWSLIPMFHYDPRRWCNLIDGEMDDDNWTHGPWNKPFEFVATQQRTGIFIGFKMYPPLGYKPLDPRLPNLEEFYSKCEAEGIPILSHCSPGGMTTHEAKFYHKFDKADLKKQPERIVSCTYDPCTPMGYFFDNYVHPRNWRPVLMKYPKLKLCLAHFGGGEWDDIGLASDWVEEITNLCDPDIVQGRDSKGQEIRFENVYTDMSCYNLKDSSVKKNVCELFREMRYNSQYRHLQDKVIFGVDWYLSIVTKAPEYKEYVESFFDTMGEIDQWQWYRSALVNPAVFYGLDNREIIENMYKGLSLETAQEENLAYGYERIMKIKEQVETIRKELEKIKPKARG